MQQLQLNNNFNPQPSFNTNYMQQPMPNPEDITDPITAMNMALVLMAKAFKLNYSTPTNNNKRISSNPCNSTKCQESGVQNAVQNLGIQNVGNQNGLIVVLGIANPNLNPNGNENVVAARAEVRPRKRDAAFLQTQLLIAQKEEARIQLQAEEFDFMAAVGDLEEIEEVNVNCILKANLQQASTSGTQTDKAPVYDSDGSDENNSNVISVVSSVEQGGGTVEQHAITIEETHAYLESLYNNLAIKVEKVNSVNRKMKETNADLNTELARYKNQEKCFEISQEKYDKLESAHQEIHKIVKDEILHIVNQVDARVQNFEIQFLKEAAKFVRDFKSLTKEADESLAKHKALELEIERLLRAVYDKAYNDMQQKIERLQAQLGDQKGKSKDTSCVSNTLDPLSQKLENDNVELEWQVLNYAKENAHFKTTYKNLFDFITVTRTQTKTIIDSLQKKLHDTIYENDKLRAQLFDKVSKQKDITKGVDITTKTRRPQPKRTTKNDRDPSASKSSCIKNKEVKNDKSEVVCTMCKQCLITANHYVCVLNYVNGMNSRGKKQKSKVKKSNKLRSKERLASRMPSKPRSCLRWSPTRRIFDLKGKIISSSKSKCQFNRSDGYPNLFMAKAIATTCYTQNRSIIHRRFNKTPYKLINGRKLDISFLHVFGALCYPKNDREDIGKLGAKGDIGFFIGYSANSCAYRIYNRSTKKIIEAINVTFNEISAMAFEQRSSKPGLQSMNSGQISLGLDLTYAPSTITIQQPTERELDLLFKAM
ncbi:retrovirus-related pol polyprotein from transposon TNT 1-94 [Tanacetum coccineum]|uniref:Retrovirus-related pol polyprotein from transposon TNT 1-94 n=1 Tax=Tanacetum coccineum TaxID=301880 RepID=A0ABQ4WDX5_9ASTR